MSAVTGFPSHGRGRLTEVVEDEPDTSDRGCLDLDYPRLVKAMRELDRAYVVTQALLQLAEESDDSYHDDKLRKARQEQAIAAGIVHEIAAQVKHHASALLPVGGMFKASIEMHERMRAAE